MFSNNHCTNASVRYEEHLTDDFINGSDEGLLNWREANVNGSTVVSSNDVDANHLGMLYQRLNAAAAADGRTSTTLGTDMFNVSTFRSGIEGICKFNENSLETAYVKYFYGWSDNNQMHSVTDGAYFEIIADGVGEGLGRVYCVTEIGGTKTSYDTGIDLPEDEWFSMRVGIPSNGGAIKFVLNNIVIHRALRTTMGVTVKMTCGFGQYYDYTGTPLPNNKEWFIDAFSIKYRMSGDRVD